MGLWIVYTRLQGTWSPVTQTTMSFYTDHIGLRQLTFGGLCIAIGSEAQLDKASQRNNLLRKHIMGRVFVLHFASPVRSWVPPIIPAYHY